MDRETLHGGVNAVRRIGSTVVRPIGEHTPSVHRLLRHVRRAGLDRVPDVINLDVEAGTESVSFMPGACGTYPMAEPFRTDRALVAAAELLRNYHDATADFAITKDDRWYLAPRAPVEVISHGDFAPYNCALTSDFELRVFDFDTAHPGPRLDDVGYGAYRWVPLTGPDHDGGSGDTREQARRLKLFCDTYGGMSDRSAVLDAAVNRLRALIELMRGLAEQGHSAFVQHLAEGHDTLYLSDIEYIASNARVLAD